MVFSSLLFLFVFLPITLALYYLVPRRARNPVLLLVSLIFYSWGEPVWVVIMLFSSVLDFCCSNYIEAHREHRSACRRALAISMVLNLLTLCFFKYTDFILDSIPFLSAVPRLGLELPIGISFYTFQTMSCTIDVYRQEAKAQRNLVNFSTYVTLFPQLIAGPIVRYKDLADQLTGRRESISQFSAGIATFCAGLCKKVLLANQFGQLWEQVQSRTDTPALTALLGILCFSLQIYFDFSGYSDMAIGLGRLFGFELPINFNYPYISRSISEFWRRWHITLGTWFREYVYIPLGGNRCGPVRLVRNMLVVWFLTGLWHGASWNFVLWGLYFGVLLLLEKLVLANWLKRTPAIFQHLYALFFIVLGWVFFSFTDMETLGAFFQSLLGVHGVWESWTGYQLLSCLPLLIVAVIACTPLPRRLWQRLIARVPLAVPVVCTISLIACCAFLVDASYNPFLYFRF